MQLSISKLIIPVVCSLSIFTTNCGTAEEKVINASEEIMDQLETKFLSSRNEWWRRNLTESYPWLKSGEILWYLDTGSPKSAIVYVDNSGKESLLNSQSGHHLISTILEKNLPDALNNKSSRDLLIKAVKDWVVDPRSQIGSRGFLMESEPLEDWLQGELNDPLLFKKYCTNPVYKIDSLNHHWELEYYVFNPSGGVDLIKIGGTKKPFQINQLSIKEVLRSGSFYFPLML